MKYGHRLKAAREYAGLTQSGLAERANVGTQESISKLERTDAKGSEFTVQYAMACGVNPVWLATGEGEMAPTLYYTSDPKIIAAAKVMEAMPEYGKDAAVKEVASTAQLIDAARHQTNGTDG